jgi:hypothetical protein
MKRGRTRTDAADSSQQESRWTERRWRGSKQEGCGQPDGIDTRMRSVGRSRKPPAQETLWTGKVPLLHKGLTKAESSIATQLRTGRIGFRSYLHDRGVPGFDSPSCPCGSNRQTPKHIVIHCPLHIEGRAAMLHRAGTSDYRSILRTNKGLRAVTRWLVRSGALQQFSLAREMAIEDVGSGEEEA